MSTANQRIPAHSECYREAHCGRPGCPAGEAQARRALARAHQWRPIDPPTGQGTYGSYHHLDGEPITCSSVVLMQVIEPRTDDYGEYSAYLPKGISVRLEPGTPARLVTHHAGCEFSTALQPWMRFRWPATGGGRGVNDA